MKKIIILTGAVKEGYGEGILRKLIQENYYVVGTYEKNDLEKANILSGELQNLELFEVDHSSRKSLSEFVKNNSDKNIAGLINAQMFFNMEDPQNFDYELWDKSIAINLTAPNFLFHEFKPYFNEGASIITITSTEGFIGSFGASAYAASKAAIHNLIKSHANAIGRRNVRVNAIAAGWIGGVMDTDEVFNMSRNITPLGRLGTADEIADIVLFLISSQSSFINGSVLTADGGYSGVDTISKYEFEQSKMS